jgi:colicin import membrane protein
MASTSNDRTAFALSLGLHVVLLLAIWASASWMLPVQDEPAAGEPIQATLQLSAADLRRARQAIAAAEKAVPAPEPPAAPAPQPKPVEKPQIADTPPQPVAQERLDKPDTEDQEEISKLAVQPPVTPKPVEQEARNRQDQVDLTEDQVRQRIAERRQQLRAQMEEIQRERELAARRTRLEEQRLQQLADAQANVAPPRPAPPAPAPPGNRGEEAGLLAKYKAAMQLTADSNWNHLGLPPRTQCRVRFTQITGGEVINVEFIDCPYDAEGRESVDRALRKTPMPYSGFESVFARLVTLNFCYPREECAP